MPQDISLLKVGIAIIIKNSVRQTLCRQRRMLTDDQKLRYAKSCNRQLQKFHLVTRAQHIALYLAHQGEMDLSVLITYARKHKKKLYLPLLPRKGAKRLLFAQFTQTTTMVKNRYGFLEPDIKSSPIFCTAALDIVLMPIVAFDKALNRLGMGGGFYDHTFLSYKHLHKPKLIGIAYEFQRIMRVPCNDLDVPMDAMITENKIYQKT